MLNISLSKLGFLTLSKINIYRTFIKKQKNSTLHNKVLFFVLYLQNGTRKNKSSNA